MRSSTSEVTWTAVIAPRFVPVINPRNYSPFHSIPTWRRHHTSPPPPPSSSTPASFRSCLLTTPTGHGRPSSSLTERRHRFLDSPPRPAPTAVFPPNPRPPSNRRRTGPGSDTVRTPWWFDTSSRLAFWRSYNIQEDDIEDDTEDILVAAFTTERVITQPTHPLSDFGPWLKRDNTVEFQLVLDSGASMHVVGDKRILREVNLFKVPSWATLPDNSQLRVVGIGVIEMGGFRIPNVSLVEGLRKNLISVSQLDADHGLCSCFRKRMCEVMTAGGTVVGGAILEDDNLYVLRYLQVPKPDDTDP